jgi:hypothetical protein
VAAAEYELPPRSIVVQIKTADLYFMFLIVAQKAVMLIQAFEQ